MFLLFSVFPPRQNKARHENENSKAQKNEENLAAIYMQLKLFHGNVMGW